ncbi:Aladin, partial [Tinamus guttatus]
AGCSIRAFAWHPHTSKFAVALLDDSIRVYNSSRHFRPPGASLSLECGGLPGKLRPWTPLSFPVVFFFCPFASARSLPGLPPFLAGSRFSCRSRCSARDARTHGALLRRRLSRLLVRPPRLFRLGGLSPSWDFKPASAMCHRGAAPRDDTRVWEAQTWTCERWPTLRGRCQTGCWSPDGSRLLFSVLGESVIYSLSFSEYRGEMQGQVGGSKTASIVADLSETTFETLYGEERIGGEVTAMAWDPSGERLAVIIRGKRPSALKSPSRRIRAEGAGSTVITVFRTRNSPVFELLP